MRPVLDRFPGVHCNEAVVACIKKNSGALLEAFREVCRSESGGGAPPQQPRVQLLPDNKYTEYEAHFQRFLDEPQPLVVVEADGAEADGYTPQPLLARDAGKYDLVYRVAFPKGCPLQVRKEIMAELYFKHVHVDPEHRLAEYQSGNKQHEDAVTRMRWCPLREITVGKQLLRHSVSVSSLRSSLQPTHGIFAWDATAICNLDDVHQAVGRINGKRYHRLHLEACYPGKATMKERRPQLCIAEGFYNMVADFAAAMEALKNKFPNAKLSPNGLSPNDYAGFLGYASAAGHGELQNGETEAMFGKPGIKGPKTHVTQARIIRSLTDEAFGRGGTARATMPDGLTELGKFLALTADGDASDSDSESGQDTKTMRSTTSTSPTMRATWSRVATSRAGWPRCCRGAPRRTTRTKARSGRPCNGPRRRTWSSTRQPTSPSRSTRATARTKRRASWRSPTRSRAGCSRPRASRASAMPARANNLSAVGALGLARREVPAGEQKRPEGYARARGPHVNKWSLDSPPLDCTYGNLWGEFLAYWCKRLGHDADAATRASKPKALQLENREKPWCCFKGCDKNRSNKRFCEDHADRCTFTADGVCGKKVEGNGKYCRIHTCQGDGCKNRPFSSGSTLCIKHNSEQECTREGCSKRRFSASPFCGDCKAKAKRSSPNRSSEPSNKKTKA